MAETTDKTISESYAHKEELARMAYKLDSRYRFLEEEDKLEGIILNVRSQQLFIDNESYSLGEEDMDFGIDVTVKYNGSTVFRAKGPWLGRKKFLKYISGEWEDKIREIYDTCQQSKKKKSCVK
jgi:hypothetical protein